MIAYDSAGAVIGCLPFKTYISPKSERFSLSMYDGIEFLDSYIFPNGVRIKFAGLISLCM